MKFNKTFGTRNGKNFEYVIIMTGSRVENFSKDGDKTAWGCSNFLEVLNKENKNIKLTNVLIDADSPLEKQSKLMATAINKLKENKNCRKIHLIAISKCGTMAVAMLKYLKKTNLEKLNIIAYSAPYLGTIYASPNLLYKQFDLTALSIEKTIFKKITPYFKISNGIQSQNTTNFSKISQSLKKLYFDKFSQSHMDYDISSLNEKRRSNASHR